MSRSRRVEDLTEIEEDLGLPLEVTMRKCNRVVRPRNVTDLFYLGPLAEVGMRRGSETCSAPQ